MKTAKIAFSILGVVLATLSYGQLFSLNDLPEENENDVLFYMALYNEENGTLMHSVNQVPMRAYERDHQDENTRLAAFRTYYGKALEVLYEEIPALEEWMIHPFEYRIKEEDPGIEDWMIEDWI